MLYVSISAGLKLKKGKSMLYLRDDNNMLYEGEPPYIFNESDRLRQQKCSSPMEQNTFKLFIKRFSKYTSFRVRER